MDSVASAALTYVDYGILGILVLSALFGFMRGFTKEALTIGAWILSAFVTLYGLDYVKPLTRQWVGHEYFGDVLAIFLIFVISLLIFSMVIRSLSAGVKNSLLGGLDRTLGVAFGAGRGIVVLVLIFLGSTLLWKHPEDRPAPLRHARFLPLIIKATEVFLQVLPKDLLSPEVLKALGKRQEASAEELMKSLSQPRTEAVKQGPEGSYSIKERDALSHLFSGKES